MQIVKLNIISVCLIYLWKIEVLCCLVIYI